MRGESSLARDSGSLIDRVEAKLAAMPEDVVGTEREVDLRNELGWALVPVHFDKAREIFQVALSLAKRAGRTVGEARATLGLAYVDFHRADYGAALEKAAGVAPILSTSGSSEDRCNLQLLEGHVQWSLGDFELAIETLVRCRGLARSVDYPFGVGWSETSLAAIYEGLGNLERATELHRSAIECFERAQIASGAARARSGLGMVYYRQGRYRDALSQQRESLESNRAVGAELGAARALNDMGLCYQSLGDTERAVACLSEALSIRERFGNWPAVVSTLLALGSLHNQEGRPGLAAESFERASVLAERISTRPKLWQALEGLSVSLEAQGDYRRALDHYRRAQAIKEDVQGQEASTQLKNLQVRYETEASKKEAELERVRGVELASALERLKQAQARIIQSEKMAAIGCLVAGVSHELNNPVAALVSAMDTQVRAVKKLSERIRGREEEAGDTRLLEILTESSGAAATACERISVMVRRLQSFSQLDLSEFRRADVRECVESAFELVRSQKDSRIAWTLELGELEPFDFFPGALNQALMTLLLNAAESIEGEGSVRVSAERSENEVRIRVSDTGRGIEPARIERLFDVGFRDEGSRVEMQAGLANVRAIVDQHQGDVTVESVLGRGTTFTIALPTRPR